MEEVDGRVVSTSPGVESGINVAQGGPPVVAVSGGGGEGRTGGLRWDPPPQSGSSTLGMGGGVEGVGAAGVEWASGAGGGAGGGM